VFDQWVPDEAEPRRGSRGSKLVARLIASGQTLARARATRRRDASYIDGFSVDEPVAQASADASPHHLWAHVVAAAGVSLIVASVLLAPGRAHGDPRALETLALFRRTGGDLSDTGMKVLAGLDPSAALIANRLARIPPAPEFHGAPGSDGELPTPPTLNLPGMTPDQARMINAAIPIAGVPNPAARPFFMPPTNLLDATRAVDCLTAAVYYEAASEPLEGQQAVAQVILNRMRHPAFPKSVCGVVFQGSNRTTGCQFTFTCDGSLFRKPSLSGWARARQVAAAALNGYVMPSIGNATHYHADYVAPYWSTSLIKVAKVGAHIFYRWTGGWGQPRAFDAAYAGGELPMLTSSMVPLDSNLSVTLAPTSGFNAAAGQQIAASGADVDAVKPEDKTAKIEVAPVAPVLTAPAPVAVIEAPKVAPKKAPAPHRDTWNRLPVPHGSF
jgi:spore germination cell wall hydrolase CwlJ-like protein